MIVLSNTTAQTLTPGQSITFNDTILHTGCAECHRNNTGSIKLRANGAYEVSFSGNVSRPTAATQVQLTVQLGGANLPETQMISTPSAASSLNNVSTSTIVKNCCGDYDRITVVNTGATDINIVSNPVITIKSMY